jgi:hypothetical protein
MVSPLDVVMEVAAKEAAMIEDLWLALQEKNYEKATTLAGKLAGRTITTSPVSPFCSWLGEQN